MSHRVLVGGVDSFMSGWGDADGGKSYAFWGCRPEDEVAVREWVGHRDEIRRVRVVVHSTTSKPPVQMSARDHCHVYHVREGHPALD